MAGVELSHGGFTRPTNSEIAASLAFLLGIWFALALASLGVETVLFDRDIITDSRAGVGLGPAMVLGALLATAATLAVTTVSRRRAARTNSPYALASVLASVVAYLAYLLVGAAGWLLFVPVDPIAAFLFAGESAIDWPALTLALVTFMVAMAYFAYISWRTRHIA